jgi:hypothetical protein
MSNNTLNTRVSDLPDHGSHNPTSKCCLAISVTSPHQVHVGPKLPNNYWCQTARLGIDSGYHCRGISHIYHIYNIYIYISYICSHIFHLTYIIYHISQLLVLPWCFSCASLAGARSAGKSSHENGHLALGDTTTPPVPRAATATWAMTNGQRQGIH